MFRSIRFPVSRFRSAIVRNLSVQTEVKKSVSQTSEIPFLVAELYGKKYTFSSLYDVGCYVSIGAYLSIGMGKSYKECENMRIGDGIATIIIDNMVVAGVSGFIYGIFWPIAVPISIIRRL